jgi:hypothetical protein
MASRRNFKLSKNVVSDANALAEPFLWRTRLMRKLRCVDRGERILIESMAKRWDQRLGGIPALFARGQNEIDLPC